MKLKKLKNDILYDNNKKSKRRNKFEGKEDISRENDETATIVSVTVNILYEKCIPIDTEKFEQLNRCFIGEMEKKIRKVKQPFRGLKWYNSSVDYYAGFFIFVRLLHP